MHTDCLDIHSYLVPVLFGSSLIYTHTHTCFWAHSSHPVSARATHCTTKQSQLCQMLLAARQLPALGSILQTHSQLSRYGEIDVFSWVLKEWTVFSQKVGMNGIWNFVLFTLGSNWKEAERLKWRSLVHCPLSGMGIGASQCSLLRIILVVIYFCYCQQILLKTNTNNVLTILGL